MILLNGKRIDSTVGDALPIGTLSPFVGLVAPKGYLICMGQLVDKAKYPELWEICGDTFGPSTSTQFYLPDLRGQTIAGYKQGDATFGTLGALIGGKTTSYTPAGTNTGGSVGNHTLTTSEIPSHNHAMKTRYDDYNWDNGYGSVQGVKRAGAWAAILSDWSTEYGGAYDFEKDWPVTNSGGGGAHNHGFTNPTFTGTQANISTVQPTAVMNWIIKASMIAVIESNIEDSLTSTSATDALSARQGKVLNDKFDSYSLSTHTHGLLHNDFTVLLPNSATDNGWSLINSTYNGYLLKSIRGNSQTPAWFTSNYAAGIAFGGADTKGVISLSYNANERITKFAGGNGTGPTWWYGIKGASGTTYDLADIKTKVDSNSWSSSVTLYNSGGDQVYYRVNTGLKLVSVTGSAPAGTNVLGTIPYKPHDKSVWVEIPTGGNARGYFSIDTSGKLTTYNQDSSSHGFYVMYTYN